MIHSGHRIVGVAALALAARQRTMVAMGARREGRMAPASYRRLRSAADLRPTFAQWRTRPFAPDEVSLFRSELAAVGWTPKP
jgi:hypothetical protein